MIIEFKETFINLAAVGYIKKLFACGKHRIAIFTGTGSLMTEFLYDLETSRDVDYNKLSIIIRNSKHYAD